MAAFCRKVPGVIQVFSACSRHMQICQITKRYAVTGHTSIDRALTAATGGKIEGWMKGYERVVGLTDVREAQDKVIQAEAGFINAQLDRRSKSESLMTVQQRLRELGAELEKVHRGDERYLALLTQEHSIIKDERQLSEEIAFSEQEERVKFLALSSAVRESHEKERARTERTKYWSIIGSVIGAIIGILGTSINNYLRMREIRGIVTDSAEGGVELRGLVTQLSSTMGNQHNQMSTFIHDLRAIVGNMSGNAKGMLIPVDAKVATSANTQQFEKETRDILDQIKKQDEEVEQEIKAIKDILASSKAVDSDGNIVYVGPQLEGMLENTERHLEWRIKINALWTVTLIYGAFALTLPVLYNIFRGT